MRRMKPRTGSTLIFAAAWIITYTIAYSVGWLLGFHFGWHR